MRMWMTNVKYMCRKHLLGEHNECHMLVGTLKKKGSINGYINNNLLEPLHIDTRHDEIAEEMVRRGYNHKTPLTISKVELEYLPTTHIYHKINKKAALEELLSRCEECKANFKKVRRD